MLFNLGVIVSPTQIAVPSAYEAFDENGMLKDSAVADRVNALVQQVINISNQVDK